MEKYKVIEFMECDTCRKKPGSPTLCEGCLHNRREMEDMNKFARVLANKRDILQKIIELEL